MFAPDSSWSQATRGCRGVPAALRQKTPPRLCAAPSMQIVVTNRPAFAFGPGAVASEDTPTAAWGDLAFLFDVEMHQLT